MDHDATGSWSETGTWSVNDGILSMVDEEGMVVECYVDRDGDRLTFTKAQYLRVILRAGEMDEDDRAFFNDALREGDRIRFFFAAR